MKLCDNVEKLNDVHNRINDNGIPDKFTIRLLEVQYRQILQAMDDGSAYTCTIRGYIENIFGVRVEDHPITYVILHCRTIRWWKV